MPNSQWLRNQWVFSNEFIIWWFKFFFLFHHLYYVRLYSHNTNKACTWMSAYPTTLRRLKFLIIKTESVQNNPPNRTVRNFLHHDKVCNYLVLKIQSYGKHLHFVNKMGQYSSIHIYKSRSNVGKLLWTPYVPLLLKMWTSELLYLQLNNFPNQRKQTSSLRKPKSSEFAIRSTLVSFLSRLRSSYWWVSFVCFM